MTNGMSLLADAALVAAVNSLWPGVVLALVVWCLFRVTRFSNAATRYVVWWIALLAVVSLPIAIAFPEKTEQKNAVESPRVSASAERSPSPRATKSLPPAPPVLQETGVAPEGVPPIGLYSQITLDRDEPEESLEGAAAEAGWGLPLRLAPRQWSAYVLLGWLAVVLSMLGRVAWSYVHLRRLKSGSAPLDRTYQERLDRWLGRRGTVALGSSDEITVPLAAGLAKPAILLPRGLAEQLSREELDQVVLHELAHLRRGDDWTNLAQKIVEAFFFFHPAVRFIGRQLNMDREIACDDWAITLTGKPKPYAACLTKLVELTGRVEAPALAPGGWTTRKQIVRRVEMSLNRRRNASPRLSRVGLLLSLLVVVLVGLQVARTAPMVVAAPQGSTDDEAPKLAALMAAYEPIVRETWADEQETQSSQEVAEQERRQLEEEQAEAAEEQAQAAEEQAREIKEHAERLEREARERSKEMQRHVRMQQRALAEQQREIERQVRFQANRAQALASRRVLAGDNREPAISEDELLELMLEIAQDDPDPEVREAAFRAIGHMGSEKALEALIALYDSLQDPRLQRAVITSIGFTGEPTESAITKFREIATTSSDPGLQQSAIRALAHTQSDRGVDVLISIYDGSGQTDLKKSIIRALSQCRSSRAVEKLKEIAKSDGDASLRLEAVRSLSHLGSTRSFAFPMPVEVALPAPPAPPLLPEQEEPPTPPQE